MKKAFPILAILFIFQAGCGDELECTYGRECKGNVSRTCVHGKWVEVECKDNAPVCDTTYGCMKANVECGNGIVEGDEECDGAVLNGRTCSDVSENLAGEVVCSSACRYDFSKCVTVTCHDGQKRCADNILEMCAGNAWVAATDCTEVGAVCDEAESKCVQR